MLYICNKIVKLFIMKTSIQKFLSYLSLLSLLAILEPITGNRHWSVFLVFLCFMVFAKGTADERLKTNLNKAARNGFISSIACIAGLAFLINSQSTTDTLIFALQVCLGIMMVVFAVSFTILDKRVIR